MNESQNSLCIKMLQYIHQHYNSDLTLARMSELFYMNPAYLGRLFRQHTGVGFSEYLTSYRIKIASELLCQKDLPVYEVAKAVGYSNMNYFHRVFRERTGSSPLHLRKNRRFFSEHTLPNSTELNTSGQVVLRLPASSASFCPLGSIVNMHGSGLCLYYTRYLENGGSSLACMRSFDDGLTWLPAPDAFQEDGPISGLTILPMTDGSTGAFYLTNADSGRALVLRSSYDGGRTWVRRVERFYVPRNYRLCDGRILRIRSGRLIIPFSRPSIGSDESDQQHILCHYMSDDDGITWRPSKNSLMLTCRHTVMGLQTPMLLENARNILTGYASSDLGCQYEYYSHDGGETWSQPQPSLFTSAQRPMHVVVLPDNRLMAVLNPIPPFLSDVPHEDWPGVTRLVCLHSSDGGASWSKPTLVEDASSDGSRGFGFPTLFTLPDAALLTYRALELHERQTRSELIVRRIPFRAPEEKK